jgi:hypothetical protein
MLEFVLRAVGSVAFLKQLYSNSLGAAPMALIKEGGLFTTAVLSPTDFNSLLIVTIFVHS